jgi:hypothetical protein
MKSLRMRFSWSNFYAWASSSHNIPVQLSFCMEQSSLEILLCFDFLKMHAIYLIKHCAQISVVYWLVVYSISDVYSYLDKSVRGDDLFNVVYQNV